MASVKKKWVPQWSVTVTLRGDPVLYSGKPELGYKFLIATPIDPDILEEAMTLELIKAIRSIKFKAIMEGIDVG